MPWLVVFVRNLTKVNEDHGKMIADLVDRNLAAVGIIRIVKAGTKVAGKIAIVIEAHEEVMMIEIVVDKILLYPARAGAFQTNQSRTLFSSINC